MTHFARESRRKPIKGRSDAVFLNKFVEQQSSVCGVCLVFNSLVKSKMFNRYFFFNSLQKTCGILKFYDDFI